MIPTLNTATEAVNFWADKAAEWDELLKGIDHLLPTDPDGLLPFSEETGEALREKLAEMSLAAVTVLGYYSRNMWAETKNSSRLVPHGQPTYPNNGYQQRY